MDGHVIEVSDSEFRADFDQCGLIGHAQHDDREDGIVLAGTLTSRTVGVRDTPSSVGCVEARAINVRTQVVRKATRV